MGTEQHMHDEKFMKRALELATLGLGSVSPNPMVGCVIVHDNKIIGEGWHRKFGGPHAEVNAVSQVSHTQLLKESTVYVSLEPCAHFGKTPPCADMLIANDVRKVVISNIDPNPVVRGKGIARLRAAGVEVVEGVLEKEGREMNKRFFASMEKKRPYIILKWAQTADGFIAMENFDSRWISNRYSRILVHKWRGEEDAVLVGTRTALHDDPQLNVRDWIGRNPLRVVIDRSLKLSPHLKVFDGSSKTICYNFLTNKSLTNTEFVQIGEKDFLHGLLHDLHQRNIQSLMIEGGSETFQAFLTNDLWDEARVFYADTFFEKGIRAPQLTGKPSASEVIGGDTLKMFYRTAV
jgi:diaminohydroxyphosphoribosylaminopyrimidine deaminase / 5-amino-6-(5-phosphoribosylamino)uracil reductase